VQDYTELCQSNQARLKHGEHVHQYKDTGNIGDTEGKVALLEPNSWYPAHLGCSLWLVCRPPKPEQLLPPLLTGKWLNKEKRSEPAACLDTTAVSDAVGTATLLIARTCSSIKSECHSLPFSLGSCTNCDCALYTVL